MFLVLSEKRWLRFGAFSAFYFAQGVPIGLISVAIPAWLAERGASVGEIAVFGSVVSLPWAFKLVAGPFMDRFRYLPMGFRRPWVMAAQGALIVSLLAMASLGNLDGSSLAPLMVAGFVVNAFAATQDVAVDGMAIDILPVDERGRANAFMAFGQVAGYSVYGALCGALLTTAGLPVTALVCAVTVGVIFIVIAVIRERPGERVLPWTRGEASRRDEVSDPGIGDIFHDLLRVLFLPMSLVLVGVEFLNRVRDGIAAAVFPKVAIDVVGLSAKEFTRFSAYASGSAAVIAVVLGPLIDRFGAKRFLMVALVVGAACHIAAGLLTELWQDKAVVGAAYILVSAAGQLIFVAIIALFMNLCWTRVAATQFSIYMALANVSRAVGGMLFAPFADHLTYGEDFLIMGGLLGLAAGGLAVFDDRSHAQRLERLKTSSITGTRE